MEPSEVEKRTLPSRSTRGKRISELEGVDKDVDEEFWKLTMFADEEGDNEFETGEQEEIDYEDSDMDDYSSDEEGETQRANDLEKKLAKEEKGSKKRKNVYKDESKKTKKKKKEEQGYDHTTTTTEKQPRTPKSKPVIPTEMKRSSRKATVKATEATEEKLKTKKTRTTKGPKEYKEPTQEELLEEAKITKEYNKASLQALVQIEEDIRKKVREGKSKNIDPYEPRIKYISKRGKQFIEFVNHDIPKCINQKMTDEEVKRFDIPKEEKQLKCVITGLPAKYIDPLTHKPYATVEAFAEIRQKLKNKE